MPISRYRRIATTAVLALLPVGAASLGVQARSVPLYHVGTTGPEVSIIQQELQDLRYHPGGITGTFSLRTRAAVREYQYRHRLSVDGIVGPITEGSLEQSLSASFTLVFGVFGRRSLRYLDYGLAVVVLQRDLAKLGYYQGAPDGVFNNFTLAAVRAFQHDHHLIVNGVADVASSQAIRRALTGSTGTSTSSTSGSGSNGSTPTKPPAGGMGGSGSAPTTPPAEGTGSGSTTPAPTSSRPMVLGYYVPGLSAWKDLVAHASQITAIAPLWYSLTTSNTLHNLGPNEAFVTSWAHAHHIQVYPLVINGYGNDNMLQSASIRSQEIADLLSVAKQDNYDGFNIDFESLNNPDEAGLDAFVAKLAHRLHQMGKKLIVSVGPRTSNNNGYHVYNYQALGSSADYVDLMLYDDHDNTGPAGPVAPLSWAQSITQYAEATIPSSKILVGLAGYGYDWASTGSTEINVPQALSLANKYGVNWIGGAVQEPEITYTVNGVTHTVWYENAASDALKAAWVGQDHLGGVALWDLGEEDPGFWPMLQKTLP